MRLELSPCLPGWRGLFVSQFFEDRGGTLEKCLKVCHCRRLNQVLKFSLRKPRIDLIGQPATSLKRGGGVASSCPGADLGTTHLALLGELAGIAEQVEQNLLQPHGSPRSRSAKIV